MKKVLTVFIMIALVCSFAILKASAAKVTYYTLTVASTNPTSGVSITVSPNDKNGLGSGITQFTRSYAKGTVVTLTAPATASGNPFQKWTKGSTDYSTSQTITVTMSANTTMTAVYTAPTAGTYKVLAWNDLGMHCACPGAETFLLLPPYNTLRAQVFLLTGTTDPAIVSSGVTVNYAMVENTDANLQADPYFSNWIAYSPKIFPGFQPVVGGKVMGLAGKGLSGTMDYNSTERGYKAEGIPAFPVPTGTSSDIMTDPLGSTTKRTPYLTANITVKNSSGTTVASTSTVVPVAFGGCCTCHLTLAQQHGYTKDPWGSFQYMGSLHGRDSGINFAYIDPDGDGKAGPIRCSWCHWDPAMGESSAQGIDHFWPNYIILPGANFTKANVRVSTMSFSDVLHRFHTQNSVVLTQFDANIANNCYDCHPGNNVYCYRGAMSSHAWCTDCHGNLNQRVAAGQLTQPWQQSTLPTCNAPSPGITSAITCHSAVTYPTPGTWSGLFGKYLNSRGHKGSIQCLTCHGSPHAEAPSTLPKDNNQLTAAQNDSRPLGVCTYCHNNSKSSTWGVPPHGKITR